MVPCEVNSKKQQKRRTMKKVIISAMIVASAIAFMACGGNASNNSSNADTTTAVEATISDAQAVAEEGAQGCPNSEGGVCDSAACAQKDTCTKACGENCQKAE